MSNILYVHGYRSKFDRNSKKINTLESIGTIVYGLDIDYDNETREEILKRLDTFIMDFKIDYVVGTSMGGYIAAQSGVPYISLNPALHIPGYPPFKSYNSKNLILLNKGDELFDSYTSFRELTKGGLDPYLTEGGDHRFSNIDNLAVTALLREFDSDIFFANYNLSDGIGDVD